MINTNLNKSTNTQNKKKRFIFNFKKSKKKTMSSAPVATTNQGLTTISVPYMHISSVIHIENAIIMPCTIR